MRMQLLTIIMYLVISFHFAIITLIFYMYVFCHESNSYFEFDNHPQHIFVIILIIQYISIMQTNSKRNHCYHIHTIFTMCKKVIYSQGRIQDLYFILFLHPF